MTKLKRTALAAALALAAGVPLSGMAQGMSDAGLYVGASIGQSDLGPDEDTAWKITGGYQISRLLAVELGYTDLGEVDVPGGSREATAWEVIGLARFPLGGQFGVYGLAGLANIEVEAPGGDDDSNELTFGVGGQFDVSRNLGVRAQWQRYDTDDEIDVLSVGVVWRF